MPRLLAASAILAVLAAGATATPPPVPQSRAYLLVNPVTGETLAQRGRNLELPMASTTKIMTALVTLERARLGRLLTVPREAALIGGSSARLVAGERLSVRNLLVALLVPSGNDAAVTLAQGIGGSQAGFVRMMNAEARRLRLRRTHFQTPHGLDTAGHYSTAADLVRLAERARRFPEFRRITAKRRAVIPGAFGRGRRVLQSENALLGIDRDADGVKTGHTSGAGYALVAHASRRHLGVQLYAAMIGEPSEYARAADAKRLLDWGFSQYALATPLRARQQVARLPVRDSPGVTVALVPDRPLVTAINVGRPLRETVIAPTELRAPVTAGQVVGRVTVRAGAVVVGRRRLLAERAVGTPGIVDRVRAALGRLVP